MNDPLGMRSRQSIRHLNADIEHLVHLERFAAHPLLKAYSLQFLHHNEGMAAIVIDIVNSADARVIELRSGAGLAYETIERLLVVDHLRGNEFQRDVTGKARVFRLIHHTHATTTELAHDVIVGDSLADHFRASVPSAAMLGREGRRGQLADKYPRHYR